jgi:RHS repeat-associated protein
MNPHRKRRLKRITRTTASSVSNTDYTYDGNQRLEAVTEADGRKTVFVYDAFGNRTQETITNLNNPAASGGTPKAYGSYRYAYDGNRLQTIYYTPPAGTEAVQEQFTYDTVGRIKTRSHATNGLTTYTWDDRGYLIGLTKPGTTIAYAYNALGARVSKTVNGQTTKYLTAPVFGMNHVLMELDSSNTVTARHVYGGHEQLAEELSGTNQYLLPGGSTGNITHALSSSAAVINEYSYDAFGNRTLVSGSHSTRHGYTGEEYDADTGLLYLRARYYDPQLGRFISVDPFLGRLAEPASQNRYVYVMNNPLLYTDPSGLAGEGNSNTLFQALFPAHTALVSKDPILGTPTTQMQYANLVNGQRQVVADKVMAWNKVPFPGAQPVADLANKLIDDTIKWGANDLLSNELPWTEGGSRPTTGSIQYGQSDYPMSTTYAHSTENACRYR